MSGAIGRVIAGGRSVPCLLCSLPARLTDCRSLPQREEYVCANGHLWYVRSEPPALAPAPTQELSLLRAER